MIKSPSIFTASLSALAVAGAMLALDPLPAAAQTAGDLKCRGCVGSKDMTSLEPDHADLKPLPINTGIIRRGANFGDDLATVLERFGIT